MRGGRGEGRGDRIYGSGVLCSRVKDFRFRI